LEKIYSEDPRYLDVAERLSAVVSPSSRTPAS
jgi:hypothetical protein